MADGTLPVKNENLFIYLSIYRSIYLKDYSNKVCVDDVGAKVCGIMTPFPDEILDGQSKHK